VEISSIFGLLVLLCALGVYVGYKCLESQNEKNQGRIAKIQNELLQENYQAVSNLYESNARLYHDLNNHLDILYQLLVCERLDEAKEYISRIGEPIKEMVKKRFTGNDIIDVIISCKKQKAEQLGMKTDIDAEFPVNTGIQPSDVCTALGNLLDNAIEGVEGCMEPFIRIASYREKNIYMIEVANSLKERIFLEEESGLPQTMKEKNGEHGYGLNNIRRVAQKYFGDLDIEQRDNMFLLQVMLLLEVGNEKKGFDNKALMRDE